MIAPLFKTGLMGYSSSLFAAVVIGILFGIVLERAGFGNARKMAGVFYARDFAVPRVMFTAILTAMVGIYYLSALEIMDPALLYMSNSYIIPFIVGGLLFGVGFVSGGYCPGTAVVALVNRKLDALVFLVGVCLGILVFSGMYSSIASLLTVTDIGKTTLPALLGVHPGWIMLAVIVFAFFFFGLSNMLEKRFGEPVNPTTKEARS